MTVSFHCCNIVTVQSKTFAVRKATDADVDAIHTLAGTEYTFSNQRLSKQSVPGANYSFKLFVYGFLFLIARMIIAETTAYAAADGICGILPGLLLNKKLFEFLVTYRWNEPWSVPSLELCIIIGREADRALRIV